MSIAIGDDLQMLHDTVIRFTADRCAPTVARAAIDADGEARPPFWADAAALGWVGLAVPEHLGGEGAGAVAQAVVLEQLGRSVAPGPALPTTWALAVLGAADGVRSGAAGASGELAALVADLATGTLVGTVALPAPGGGATSPSGGGVVAARSDGSGDGVVAARSDGSAGDGSAGDDSWVLRGTVAPVLCASVADLVLLPGRPPADGGREGGGADGHVGDGNAAPGPSAEEGPAELWWAVRTDAEGVTVTEVESLDPTRRLARVELHDAPATLLAGVTRAHVEAAGLTLAAAEAAGGAAWCVETAAAYAAVRRQFGRPIGQFQAVKHRCADMLVHLEQARGVAWDAAVALDGEDPHGAEARLAAHVAGAVALDAFVAVAKDCIQVLGGIGFTWEHDAHLYLRRAVALAQLLGGGAPWRAAVADAALAGTRRPLQLQLPPEAEGLRSEIAAVVDEIAALPKAERRGPLAEAGLIVPHWSPPWGRDASAIEQLVIDQEMRRARVRAPHLQVGAWAAPTIAAHGTPEQQERWVRPTLHGEISWCQLFSEPEAGSDLAALTTAATPTDGGWLLTGQKVWTTMAKEADWGICLARTDPSAPKHLGITYFVVDMSSPGLDIRPLRELTGLEMFNEVFLDDVFVPDDCVIGAVHGGWPLARTTLANERVSMGSGSSFGGGIEALLGLVADRVADGALADDARLRDEVGGLVAEAHSVAVMGLRSTMRSVSGAKPGPEASVRKLLGVEHDQRTQEVGLALLGPDGATTVGAAAQWTFGFLANRCLTIAGGTSEIQRNVIGERLLGLPRDPEPADRG